MNAIWLVATNTLRQTVRQRLFSNIAIFGVAMVFMSIIVGQLTLGYRFRVVRSVGLSGVTIALDLMALLVAVGLIYTDIDRKTLFVVLTRPLSRWQYAVGRYVGLLLALSIALLGFVVVFIGALWMVGGEVEATDLVALLAALPEAAILGAFGLVLSAFSTPTLSAGLGLGFWIASSTTDDLVALTKDADPGLKSVAQALYYLLPSLERFDFREHAVYGMTLSGQEVASTFLYGLLYAAALVALASLITTRREMV